MNWYPSKRRPGVVELEGGYERAPIPPAYVPPPPSNVQRVLIEEPTEGWWRGAGAFGYRFQGLVPDIEGGVIALCEQLTLPGPPAPWWVQWFRFDRTVNNAEGSPNFELRGRITYGVGGAQNIIEVDVIQGIQLPIVCNSIKVDLVTYNPLPDDDAYHPGQIVVGAMFGKGAGGGALPATWTTPSKIGLAAPGVLFDIPLPDFARAIGVHCSEGDITTPLYTDAFLNFNAQGGAGVTIQRVSLATAYAELIREGGISIPAGTNQVQLEVPVSSTTRYTLQFFLAL